MPENKEKGCRSIREILAEIEELKALDKLITDAISQQFKDEKDQFC